MVFSHLYCTFSRFRENAPVYNFTSLDALLAILRSNGLSPGFELMGNPSGYFTDFENKTQVKEWRRLVHLIAARYICKYSITYIDFIPEDIVNICTTVQHLTLQQ